MMYRVFADDNRGVARNLFRRGTKEWVLSVCHKGYRAPGGFGAKPHKPENYAEHLI